MAGEGLAEKVSLSNDLKEVRELPVNECVGESRYWPINNMCRGPEVHASRTARRTAWLERVHKGRAAGDERW